MYYPVLKGKAGEFEAWKNVSPFSREQICPVFEIVPEKDILSDLTKFRDMLIKSSTDGDIVAIDFGALENSPVDGNQNALAYSWLASELADVSINFYAVVHLEDELNRVQDAIRAVGDENLLLRVFGTEVDPDPLPNDTSLEDWCYEHSLQPEKIALMIDLQSIYGLDGPSVYDLAITALAWAADNGPWESVILASGGFPQQISALKKGVYHFLERTDAALWIKVREQATHIHYSDYGIRHPDLPSGEIRNGPLPNLRYTTGPHWIVWREGKDSQKRFSTFYDVCANIIAHPEFSGAGFSWGDKIIEEKSRRQPGPGAGQQWISYGLNHHLELVADRLATVHEP